MAKEKDIIEFNEQDAIAWILNNLDDEHKIRLDEIKIQYILDLITEYYDENGYFEEGDDETVDEAIVMEEEMINWILEVVKKEKLYELSDEDIQIVLDGEYAYGVTIGIYEPDDEE